MIVYRVLSVFLTLFFRRVSPFKGRHIHKILAKIMEMLGDVLYVNICGNSLCFFPGPAITSIKSQFVVWFFLV